MLGLETLVELHSADELSKLPPDADIAGINNRDLTSFNTDISNCTRLVDMLPAGIVKVAESGMKTPEDIVRLKKAGFDAFLIGEALMGTPEQGKHCGISFRKQRSFIREVTHETEDKGIRDETSLQYSGGISSRSGLYRVHLPYPFSSSLRRCREEYTAEYHGRCHQLFNKQYCSNPVRNETTPPMNNNSMKRIVIRWRLVVTCSSPRQDNRQ